MEALEAHENPRPLELRDDPPPYVSSIESEDLEGPEYNPSQRASSLPEELIAIMERPLDEDEILWISRSLYSWVQPEVFYFEEAEHESCRFEDYCSIPQFPIFRQLNGPRQQGIIVRHCVKRRWEKLGVWNPKWRFALHNKQGGDDMCKWTWWWQPEGARDDIDRAEGDARELITRALRLRQNLRRGEHAPVLPRSCPRQGTTTAAQAESFLISRPWFIFIIEHAEEDKRYRRLPIDVRRRYPYEPLRQVLEWWEERGDLWRWSSWKWRHESPSPEPENLAPLYKMKRSPLDAAAEMGFTPSEVDELEDIERPRSEEPEGSGVVEENDWSPLFPGQMADLGARANAAFDERAEEAEIARAEGRLPEEEPSSIFWSCERVEDEATTELHEDASEPQREAAGPPEEVEDGESREIHEDASEPKPEAAGPPAQEPRRLRQRQPRQGGNEVQRQDAKTLPPPLRRSERIAGIKRPAEEPPSQAAPKKRLRGRAVPETPASVTQPASATQPTAQEPRSSKARPVPARPPPGVETQTQPQPKRGRGRPRKEQAEIESQTPQPKRGRGRPRKEQAEPEQSTTCPAVKKTVASTAAVAKGGRTITAGTAGTTNMPAATATGRRRGRPRKI